MRKLFFFPFLIFKYIICDLPVHCLLDDVKGTWDFFLEDFPFHPDLSNYKTSCGHGFPNKIEKDFGDSNYTFPNELKLTLTLQSDYLLYQEQTTVGNWTLVYDQGFIIWYHNKVLYASFKYFFDDDGNYASNCGKTMIGWYKDEEVWRCMYGIKQKDQENEKNFSYIQTKQSIIKDYQLLYLVDYDDLNGVVEEINASRLGWTGTMYEKFRGKKVYDVYNALGLIKGRNKLLIQNSHSKEVCLIQKKYPFLRPRNDYISQSYASFMKKIKSKPRMRMKKVPIRESFVDNAKRKKSLDEKRDKDSQFVTSYEEVSKYIDTPIEEIDENTLPLNWDWRNVGGITYVPFPEAQGDCGSCYIFSTIQSLESRLRIKTNNEDQTQFSFQFPLSCNFYSEGCDGGYPILVAKFFSEFEIVPRECFKYTATNNKCSNVCNYLDNSKKYRVSSYGYLGGFYGGTNEIQMMKEIRARGPIPGNMKVPFVFNFYKRGIFSTRPEIEENSDRLSKVRLVDKKLSFETVEHSIILVGWGEENGVKYWIGMNTWGKDWGEQGYFKILRGENEQSIETMGDYFNIYTKKKI